MFLHISGEDQITWFAPIIDFFVLLQPCFTFNGTACYVSGLLQQIELGFLCLVDVNPNASDRSFFTYFTPCFFKTNSHIGTTLRVCTTDCDTISSETIVHHNKSNEHDRLNLCNRNLHQLFHMVLGVLDRTKILERCPYDSLRRTWVVLRK